MLIADDVYDDDGDGDDEENDDFDVDDDARICIGSTTIAFQRTAPNTFLPLREIRDIYESAAGILAPSLSSWNRDHYFATVQRSQSVS